MIFLTSHLKSRAFLILMITIFLCLLSFPFTNAMAGDDGGEITIYNETDKNLYITIADENAGQVDAGMTDTFECGYGEHRVEAEWDGGTIHKYIHVTKTYPNASWTIEQDDVND